jgi:hypothetical protein
MERGLAGEQALVARGLAARRFPGDVFDVGAIDAEIMQLAVRIGRKFLNHRPVHTPLAEKSPNEGKVHGILHLVWRPPKSVV